MKSLSLSLVFLLLSCGNKEDILLPKSNVTIVNDVADHSPIYIFFRVKNKDTLAEVNRKNSIISTNWILNIDKRLPLKLVIPEVMKLQEKKRGEVAHKNEKAENYYSYADSIGKNMAFISFTKVYYKLEKPAGTILFFNKKNEILIDNQVVQKEKVQEILNDFLPKNSIKLFSVGFDENLDFGSYVQDKIFIESINVKANNNLEYIY